MTGEAPPTVSRVLRAVELVEDALLIVLLAGMIGLASAQIILRNVFGGGLLWADPSLRIMVLWVGMVGAMVATRYDKQITVDALARLLPDRWKAGIRLLTDLFTASVAAVVAWNAGRLVIDDRAAGSVVFGSVPVWVCELVLPLAFGVIALRYLAYAVRHARTATTGRGEP